MEQRWWTVADLLIYYSHEPSDHDEEHFPVKILCRLIHTSLVAKLPFNEKILKMMVPNSRSGISDAKHEAFEASSRVVLAC